MADSADSLPGGRRSGSWRSRADDQQLDLPAACGRWSTSASRNSSDRTGDLSPTQPGSVLPEHSKSWGLVMRSGRRGTGSAM